VAAKGRYASEERYYAALWECVAEAAKRTRGLPASATKMAAVSVRRANVASNDDHFQRHLGEHLSACLGDQAGAPETHRHPAVGVEHHAMQEEDVPWFR
jgi:hypothetical protein